MLLCVSSGELGEVLLVALGEVVVVAWASLEFWDAGEWHVEGLACVAVGESGALAGSAQVGAVGGLGRVGEEPVDLACDVAFEAADDLAAGFAVGASALGVVDGALVDAQPGDGDAP